MVTEGSGMVGRTVCDVACDMEVRSKACGGEWIRYTAVSTVHVDLKS